MSGHEPNLNPYQPPSYPTQAQWAQTPGPGQVSPAILESLRKTRPWVMLLAVLGSISVGFMVLGGLAMMATVSGAAGFAYLVMAGIYMLPLVAMYRFAGAINRLLHGGGQQELEQAVDAQQSIWQVMGIMTLIAMVLAVVMVFGMAAFVASEGSNFRF